jgi:hypothetical protein
MCFGSAPSQILLLFGYLQLKIFKMPGVHWDACFLAGIHELKYIDTRNMIVVFASAHISLICNIFNSNAMSVDSCLFF